MQLMLIVLLMRVGTARQVYDLYKDFAIYAQSQGDTVGRKMIVPDAGAQLPDGVDFVRLMYTSSISERGTNAELFYSKIEIQRLQQILKAFHAQTLAHILVQQ